MTLLFPLLLLSCATAKKSEKDCFIYPNQIDSLKVENLYDSARWYIFTWLSDKKHNGSYYSELELRYDTIFLRNDSLEIFFKHYMNEKFPETDLRSDGIAQSSVAFNISSKKKLWTFNKNDFSNG